MTDPPPPPGSDRVRLELDILSSELKAGPPDEPTPTPPAKPPPDEVPSDERRVSNEQPR